MGQKPTKKEAAPEAQQKKPEPSTFSPPARPSQIMRGKAGAVNHDVFIVDNTGKLLYCNVTDKSKLGEGS